MSELKLNETPVRTSRNFNINNIKIRDLKLPEKINSFDNVKISGIDSNVVLKNKVPNYKLKYGVGNDLLNEVQEKANQNLMLEINGEASIEIENSFDEDNKNLVDNIEFVLEEDSRASVIIKYKSKNDIEHYHNGVIRVSAKKNSKLNIIIVNLLSISSNNFLSIENNLEDNASVNYTIIDFGGKNSITNYYCNLFRKRV